jgi:hypothetical protein
VAGEELSPDAIEWRSRPWRGSSGAIGLVGVLFLGLGWYAAAVAKDWVWTGLTAVAAAYMLSPLLVPVTYRVDASGITRRSWLSTRQLAWQRFADWRVLPSRRIAVLRFAGKGMARLAGGMSLFLPEEPLRARVLEELSRGIGPEASGR